MLIVGVVNLLPILPLLIPEMLDTMYQVAPADPTSEILLRHRALVLGLVGVALIVVCVPKLLARSGSHRRGGGQRELRAVGGDRW